MDISWYPVFSIIRAYIPAGRLLMVSGVLPFDLPSRETNAPVGVVPRDMLPGMVLVIEATGDSGLLFSSVTGFCSACIVTVGVGVGVWVFVGVIFGFGVGVGVATLLAYSKYCCCCSLISEGGCFSVP